MNFSIAGIKNQLDEVRAQVYPRNETERKVYEALSSKNWLVQWQWQPIQISSSDSNCHIVIEFILHLNIFVRLLLPFSLWNRGASTTLLNDIAAESLDYEKYNIITNLIWANLESTEVRCEVCFVKCSYSQRSYKLIMSKIQFHSSCYTNNKSMHIQGKSWKQIFKTLTLVEFLIKNGSERFIEGSRDKLYKIRNLGDYNFYEGTWEEWLDTQLPLLWCLFIS